MKSIDFLTDKLVGALAGASVGGKHLESVSGAVQIAESNSEMLRERLIEEITSKAQESITDLELAIEDVDWREIGSEQGNWNFSSRARYKLITLSRKMFLLNPLMKRAVTVQELYVWGSGCTIKGESDIVTEVLNDFFNHPKNQKVIGQAWAEREREQRIDGNTFFVFFFNKRTGTARIRLLPIEQTEEIITDPEDSKVPWFYKRVTSNPEDVVLYPDIDHNPKYQPKKYQDWPIDWNTRVIHVKTGGLSMMKFGLPELYSALNWATAYKKFLEHFSSLMAAYSRLAMRISKLPGERKVAGAKSKLNTGITSGSIVDNNPSNNTAGTFLSSGNVTVEPIRTANSTTGPDEARALRSMVAAGSDTPEHFFGDSDIGNFATSTTLDRPTELKMVARQGMWAFVITQMCQFLIKISAESGKGKLNQAGYKTSITFDPHDGDRTVNITPPAKESIKFSVTFPSILERDVVDRVKAVVAAITLNGSPAEGIIPNRAYVAKLLLVALGEKDADEIAKRLYPEEVMQGYADPKIKQDNETLIAKGRKQLGDAAIKQANKPVESTVKPQKTPKNN